MGDSCLLVGLDSGFLQLHAAASGALMLRQQLHEGPVLSIQTRHASSVTAKTVLDF